MYKKRLLNSAIALALATGASGAALAVVNVDTGATPATYANEPLETTNFGKPDGWVNDNMTATVDLTGQLGWSVGAAGAPRFMRFDFFNAVLESALAPGDLTLGIASGATFSVSIAGGGQIGQDFVIFEVTNTDGTAPINNTDSFTLDIEEVIGTKDAAEVRYRAFETGLISQNATKTDPVDPSETFKDVQVNWFNWAIGLTVGCSPVDEGVIDTIDRAFWEVAPFTPNFSRQIATTTARGNSGILNPTNSAQVAFTDFFAPGNALFSVEGNFQGIAVVTVDADQDLGTPPSEFIVPNLPVGAFAPTIARVTYNGFFAPTPPGGFVNAGLYLTNTTDRNTPPDGQPDEMVPSGFDIRFEQPIPSSNAADFRLADVVRACGETVASGSSDRLDYTASPDGTGVNLSLFRIVNPSDTAGPAVMRVYNDDGASVEFPISDVDGIDSDVLGANSSTAVIPVANVNDAAVLAGLATPAPASNGAKRDKFRIEVRGAFGQESYDGNLNFNLLFDDSDGGGIFGGPTGSGPSGSGLLRVRGQEQQGRSANGIQIQGFMLNNEGTVIPYNDR